MKDGAVAVIALFIGGAGLLGWCGYRVVANINFDRRCSGYLKNAADANTIEQAEKRLATAVKYIHDNELTDGFTSVLWTAPSEDVGFWAGNLANSLAELRTISEDATQLEKSNVLMKLRETILDESSSGQKVTLPSGISVFPNNVMLAWIGMICFVVTFIGAVGATRVSGARMTTIETVVILAIIGLFSSIIVTAG